MNAPYNIKNQAGLLLGLGLAMIVLGSLALYSTVTATFISVKLLAWLFLISGFIQVGHAFYSRAWKGFALQLVLGLISVIAGIVILKDPFSGAITLTLLLAFLFIGQGLIRIFFALTKRFEHWILILISGILSVILGIMILCQWPWSGLYIIGLFVGIDLIFNGWALIMLSSFTRRLIK
ncbi:HdeD family acid-resistance protein [soil metagenome]